MAEQLWGAFGVFAGLVLFFSLVFRCPALSGGGKDWGFFVVIVGGGACMVQGGRLMQRAYRRRHPR